MSCKSLLYATNTTSTLVAENTQIPLTTIVRRYGCDVNLVGNNAVISESGYYDITVNATFTAPVAGVIGYSIQQDGVNIPGAIGAETITTATTEVRTITLSTKVRVKCGSAPSTISLLNGGLAATYSNIALSVEKAV